MLDICLLPSSKSYVQFSCIENESVLATKLKDGVVISIVTIISAFLFLLALWFNSFKTEKLGVQYDELNLTASDYTVFVNVSARHRYEFDEKYGAQIKKSPELSRGYFFKQYILENIQVANSQIARIDLVFDNKKLIALLEDRGTAIKNCEFKVV